ncbi:hypothetical protein [Soonwooa purpurea]
MKLLLSQKNRFFEIIQDYEEISPNQFEIFEYPDFIEIKFQNSDFRFLFSERDINFYIKINIIPGENEFQELFTTKDWNGIYSIFENWINYVIRENSEVDLWSRFKIIINDLDYKNESDDKKFNVKEFIELKEKMNLIYSKINTLDILPENQKIIIEKLENITELAIDLNKFDWFNLFIGTLISIIIQLQVNKENANLLWEFIKNTFKIALIEN